MHAVIISRQLKNSLKGENLGYNLLIISWQLKNSLKGENLGYNLGPYIGRPISEADP
jgi:hypothetical protein